MDKLVDLVLGFSSVVYCSAIRIRTPGAGPPWWAGSSRANFPNQPFVRGLASISLKFENFEENVDGVVSSPARRAGLEI